jgi:glycosyltransferase involved in cell wall biosynthesis
MSDLSKLRICFIAGTLGQGGAERQLFYILRALRNQGARITLLTLTQGEFWEKRIRDLGVEIIWVGRQRSKALRLACIIATLRGIRPDVVQSQHFYTNLYAAAAARALGIREVGAMRSNGVSEVEAGGKLFGHLSLRIPRLVATNSQVAIENATKLGMPVERLRFLPNVVDTEQFTQASEQGPAKNEVRLLAVGRLKEEKRFDRFLTILADLQLRSRVKLKATIVGDGPKRESLERQAGELGLLAEVIEFSGPVADMTRVYQRADILVLTSDWEGTPNVVLEAMAAGLPVVATRVGGVGEIVRQGETGYLAEAGDDALIADSLLKLINNSPLRAAMGQRARQFVEVNHSPKRLAEILAGIYEVALS